jgi:16S rRNA (uracil1498-N3)-methyltransferase
MNIFLIEQTADKITLLNEEESFHCIKVLRMKVGDAIEMIDGKGNFYQGEIADANPKACSVIIKNVIHDFGKRNYHLHIAIAPTKNIDRFEWFLEKATEIGIDEITPLFCEHSERKEVKTERLNKVIVSAMKQSVKALQPKLNSPFRFKDFVLQQSQSRKIICSCDADKNSLLKNIYVKEKPVLILIGPEGDFSSEEIILAEKNNFVSASLGESRLRTETAGVVACNTISLLNQ